MALEPDWQSLERKLAAGMPLERAAEAAGVDIEEARRWARLELDQVDAGDVTLMRTANTMLEEGFRVLRNIAGAGPRVAEVQSSDLDAAKELVRAALAVRKMLGPARGPKGAGRGMSVQLDLWDSKGDWNLEQP